MKRVFLATIALVLLGFGKSLMAQDCRTIVEPLIIQRGIDTNTYPAEKLDIFCQISANQFYLTEQAPEGALVFDLTELQDVLTGQHIAADFVPDLSTFSYYRYNFLKFQAKDLDHTIYFRIGKKSNHTYLAVRSVWEAKERTYYPERY